MKVLEERMAEKIERITESGCHIWMATCFSSGYGSIWADGKNLKAHRVAWELANGPIPFGLHVLHRCDVPVCVNPGHLFLGTSADNMADMKAKGRKARTNGEANGNAKLTEAQVLAIRADSRTQRAIAAAYNVGHALIGYIKRREKWAHVSNGGEG